MRADDILSHTDTQLPLVRPDDDFLGFAKRTLDTYLNLVQSVHGADALSKAVASESPHIASICAAIIDALEAHFRGCPHDAFQSIDTGIAGIRSYVDRLRTSPIPTDQMRDLYRFRVGTTPPFSREDLFHIPFECRHLVTTQRYSIPGLPSLYLGGSVYACWQEMGQPAFSQLQGSCFWLKPNEQLCLLDFGHRPAWMVRWARSSGANNPQLVIDYLLSHIVCWPLIAMASIKTRHRLAPFKPEYIVPQLLLQWVSREPDVNGVRYFSTHVDCVTDNPHWICNYVFPAKTLASIGRCSTLTRLFKMTEPVNWQLLRAVNLDGIPSSCYANFDFEFIKGISESYGKSEFGLVQARLSALAEKIRRFNVAPKGDPALGDVLP